MPEYSKLFNAALCFVFPGGAGGNMLATHIVESVLLPRLSKQSSGDHVNEYFCQTYSPLVQAVHINLFFTPKEYSNDQYGQEVYTIGRYREILSKYKSTSFIFVHPGDLIAYVIGLKEIKVVLNNGNDWRYPEIMNNMLSQPSKQMLKYSKHYQTLSNRLKKAGIRVLDLDYRKLFLLQDRREIESIFGYVIGGDLGSLDLEWQVQNTAAKLDKYHKRNIQLLSQTTGVTNKAMDDFFKR
jgi:hypothetical protein